MTIISRTSTTPHRQRGAALALTATLVALSACGASEANSPDALTTPSIKDGSSTDDATPHGYIEGAQEVSEAQIALMWIDESGSVYQLDALTEEIEQLAQVEAGEDDEISTHLLTDGRRVYIPITDSGRQTRWHVVDSGRWIVDHADHVHYYLASPRDLGEIAAADEGSLVATATSQTITSSSTGEVQWLDLNSIDLAERDRTYPLETTTAEVTTLTPAADGGQTSPLFAVPFGSNLAVALQNEVRTYSRDGAVVGDHPCQVTSEWALTRAGAVITCAEGALIFPTASSQEPALLPFPDPQAAAHLHFTARGSRPVIAALVEAQTIWLLNTRDPEWSVVHTTVPLALAVAVDDEAGHILGVTPQGSLVLLDASGELIEETGRLAEPADIEAGQVTLIVDAQRAYLNSPSDSQILEIDYRDSLRIARTFTTPTAPLALAETGA